MAYSAAYYQANRAKILAYQKTWRETHRDKLKTAKRARREKAALARGLPPPARRASPSSWADPRLPLVEEFVARLRNLNRSPHTVNRYRVAACWVLRSFPNISLDRITTADLERALFARGLAPASVGVEAERIRAFFAFLVKAKGLQGNPVQGLELPRAPFRSRPAPTLEQFEALCGACATPEERVLVELLYFTGLRLSETRFTRVKDVDLAARTIRVIGKGSKERTVVFPDRLAKLLQLWIGSRPAGDWLLPGQPLRPIGAQRIEAILRRLGSEIGLPYKLTAHLLRHGFTRLMKVQGVPLEVTSRLLGHADIKMTSRIYGALDVGDLRKVYDERMAMVGHQNGGPPTAATQETTDSLREFSSLLEGPVCFTREEAVLHLRSMAEWGIPATVEEVTMYRVRPGEPTLLRLDATKRGEVKA